MAHSHNPARRRKMAGVTLIELMVVVVIIGILSAIAYPSYSSFVIRSKRVAAKSMLLRVADMQEQFIANNKRYAANLTELGLAANSLAIDDNAEATDAGSGDHVYTVTLADISNITFTAQAEPAGSQVNDTDCGTLTLNQAGVRGQSGSGENCW